MTAFFENYDSVLAFPSWECVFLQACILAQAFCSLNLKMKVLYSMFRQ